MRKTYKNDGIMKALTIIGGVLALIDLILALLSLAGINISFPSFYIASSLNFVVTVIVGLIGAVLTLLCALRPDDPIPFNWIILLIFAIWLIVFGAVLGGVLVLIAFLIGLIEDL